MTLISEAAPKKDAPRVPPFECLAHGADLSGPDADGNGERGGKEGALAGDSIQRFALDPADSSLSSSTILTRPLISLLLIPLDRIRHVSF